MQYAWNAQVDLLLAAVAAPLERPDQHGAQELHRDRDGHRVNVRHVGLLVAVEERAEPLDEERHGRACRLVGGRRGVAPTVVVVVHDELVAPVADADPEQDAERDAAESAESDEADRDGEVECGGICVVRDDGGLRATLQEEEHAEQLPARPRRH